MAVTFSEPPILTSELSPSGGIRNSANRWGFSESVLAQPPRRLRQLRFYGTRGIRGRHPHAQRRLGSLCADAVSADPIIGSGRKTEWVARWWKGQSTSADFRFFPFCCSVSTNDVLTMTGEKALGDPFPTCACAGRFEIKDCNGFALSIRTRR